MRRAPSQFSEARAGAGSGDLAYDRRGRPTNSRLELAVILHPQQLRHTSRPSGLTDQVDIAVPHALAARSTHLPSGLDVSAWMPAPVLPIAVLAPLLCSVAPAELDRDPLRPHFCFRAHTASLNIARSLWRFQRRGLRGRTAASSGSLGASGARPVRRAFSRWESRMAGFKRSLFS